ncbi:EAL domain-containing protein [Parasulfuritortus cantonensis]|uniref:EAL domain-containing protein n=1 Tax=Parasulfuritortus cantonensis TaxID=2528202 RepID=A0A4R1BAD4_9PROT|nr:EAL domain-containing protein [Parasulfuritortus cantonensis]TCJ13926.1 EAL domain-containing protein [Parasulfuritortus cantonensis]
MSAVDPGRLRKIDWSSLMTGEASHAESPLCAALALTHEAVQIWDSAGRLVMENPASEAIFGPAEAHTTLHQQLYCDCLQENGCAFEPEQLPVGRVLATHAPVNDLIMTIRPGEDDTRWLKVGGEPITNAENDLIGVVITATDITDFIEHRQRLEHLASYDPLTQLPNRLLLAERMRISLARARRSQEMVAFCMLDLDGFKAVNDSLGHHAGDELLREVAIRLEESIRGDDTVARIGGDEFAMLLGSLHKVSECEQTLTRVLTRLGQPYQIAGQTVRIGASAGVALFPSDGNQPDQLLDHADTALYQAKQAGKGRFQFFDRKLDMRLQANRGLLRKIETAIRERQFVLHYQPIVDCEHGVVEGAEALIRWHHPILGVLAPLEFLPLIDQDDLSIDVGQWVFGEALRQLAAWHAAGLKLRLSVNVFSRHLSQPGFTDWLAGQLAAYPPELTGWFVLEIAEAAVMADITACAETLHECQRLGVRVTLDNFGIGYASLPHLKRLTSDNLKIDQSLVQNMLAAADDLAIVGGIIGFAAPFGCQVAAEGAETIEHLLTLLELGCPHIQGYSLARPMPPEKFEAWLHAFQPDPLWRLSTMSRPTRDHFELLIAEANFRAWISRAIQLCKQSRYVDSLSDDRECPFGAWLHHPGTLRFRKYDEFLEIERRHPRIHQLVSQLGADCLAERVAQATTDEEQLLEEQFHMLKLLKEMRARLNRAPRPRLIPAMKEKNP